MVFLYGFAKVYSHVETGRKAMQKEIAYIYNLVLPNYKQNIKKFIYVSWMDKFSFDLLKINHHVERNNSD